MSYQHQDRGARVSRRDTLSYWLPLALTVSAAVVGIAAWVWSERGNDDGLSRGPPGDKNFSRSRQNSQCDDKSESVRSHGSEAATPLPSPIYNQSYMARMSGALRRTPSPQQIFDGASRTIVDRITAATAVVGTALGSIMEEDKNAYKDHQTWSEEVDSRTVEFNLTRSTSGLHNLSRSPPGTSTTIRTSNRSSKRKTVAIVMSTSNDSRSKEEGEVFQEHASILSYLPQKIEFSKIRLFILIYAPLLKSHPLDGPIACPELDDSTSKINDSQTQLSSEKSEMIHAPATNATIFEIIHSQALSIVEKETMILPFTSATGHVQILRQLNPDIVYLQESLSGANGGFITNLQTWLRQDVVLIVGDGCSSSGLADTDSEAEPAERNDCWWKREDKVGKGRGVIVIEAFRIGDDWEKRVDNKE